MKLSIEIGTVRLSKVTMMKIRDIQRWTGERQNTETVRQSIDSRWQHLKELEDEKNAILERL